MLSYNQVSLKDSKIKYFRFIAKHAEDFKNAKFVYNDLYINLLGKYFVLKFSHNGADLYEREYIKGKSKLHFKETYSLEGTQQELGDLVEWYMN